MLSCRHQHRLILSSCYDSIAQEYVTLWKKDVFEILLRSELIAYARCWVDALEDFVSESQLCSVHFVQHKIPP